MIEAIWLKVDREAGERWAIILSEAIREKSITNGIWGKAVFSLLDKIHQAQQANEYSVYISTAEAEALFQCLNCYFYDYPCSPFDKSKQLYNRWSGNETRRYPNIELQKTPA